MTMTEKTVTDPKIFEIYDGQRPMNVNGWLLAETDSQTGTSVRWTELSLYRALSGRYVLAKVGRSDVYHDARCSQNSKGSKFDSLDDSSNTDRSQLVGCQRCTPGNDPRPVYVEQDIHSAYVYSTPAEVSEALFRSGSDNARFLSRLGREILSQSAEKDEGMAALLNTPIDID